MSPLRILAVLACVLVFAVRASAADVAITEFSPLVRANDGMGEGVEKPPVPDPTVRAFNENATDGGGSATLVANPVITVDGFTITNSASCQAAAMSRSTADAELVVRFTTTVATSFSLAGSMQQTGGILGEVALVMFRVTPRLDVFRLLDAGPPGVRMVDETGQLAAGSYQVFLGCTADIQDEPMSASGAYNVTLTIGPLVPGPTPTATPATVRWVNAAGGTFGQAQNWSPQRVPEKSVTLSDTALLDLNNDYAISIDGGLRTIERLVVRHGRVDINDGALFVEALSPTEPSVSIENDGRLNIATGGLRNVHAIIGNAPPQDPANPPTAEVLVANQFGWVSTGNLAVGGAGKGRLFVANGGGVDSGSSTIGGPFGGEAIVGGRFSRWATGNLAVGFGGNGFASLKIEAGGTVNTKVAGVGLTDGVASVVVTGIDATGGSSSSWNTEFLTIAGSPGTTVRLDILDGGSVVTTTLNVAGGSESVGSVIVSGRNNAGVVPESRLVANSISVGRGGDEALMKVEDGGAVFVLDSGNLEIGASGPGDLSIAGQTSLVSVDGDVTCGNDGSITFNGGRLEIGGNLSIGVNAFMSGLGDLVFTNGGEVNLLGGFDPDAEPPLPALQPAALSPLSPAQSPGTFSISGDYVQGETGRLRIDIAGTAPGLFDVVAITGDATFGGTLEVAFVDGYLPQVGDSFPFLQVGGAVAGSFDRIRIRGVDEDLAFTIGLVNGVLTLTALSDAHACTGGDADGDGLAECEVCDNCIDDNGDGLVDRADPDCTAAADGAGAGSGGDAAARKALGKCAGAMATVGAKLSALVAKRLQSCTGAVLACVQTKPGDAACLAKVKTTCVKATAALAPEGSDRRKARLTIAKACGAKTPGAPPLVPLATIVAATGLGFDAEVARCAALATPLLASVDDVIACIDRATVCRASALFATRVPRASELLRTGNAEASLLACLPVGLEEGGALGDPKTTGKPLTKCQSAIAAAGANLAVRLAKGYGACAAAMRGCVQSTDPAGCLTEASASCTKATRTLPTVTGAADAKLLAALTKACGALEAAALIDANGLGFAGAGARCAALGVPALEGPAALATCLTREQACGTATLVEAATPRLRELLGKAGVTLD